MRINVLGRDYTASVTRKGWLHWEWSIRLDDSWTVTDASWTQKSAYRNIVNWATWHACNQEGIKNEVPRNI